MTNEYFEYTLLPQDLSKLHPDESIIKMVTEMQKGASKSGKKPDNMLMELLSKMSEAYMAAKTENGEYQQKIDNLAIENRLLRVQVQNLLKVS